MKKITIKGKVVYGSQDGRKLGFPTANIVSDNMINLEYGVYSSYIIIDNKKYKSITHFGPRYVFGEENAQIEVHIFDFDKDIYDKNVDVEIIDFIRKSIKFDNLDNMIEQIKKDCIVALNQLK